MGRGIPPPRSDLDGPVEYQWPDGVVMSKVTLRNFRFSQQETSVLEYS